MKQLFFDGKGKLHIEDVPPRVVTVKVQTAYSLSRLAPSRRRRGGGSLARRVAQQPIDQERGAVCVKQGVAQ